MYIYMYIMVSFRMYVYIYTHVYIYIYIYTMYIYVYIYICIIFIGNPIKDPFIWSQFSVKMIQSVPSCWSLRLSRAVKHVSSFLQFHYFFPTNVLHDLCFMCLLQFRHFHFNPFFHDSCSLHLIQVLQPFQIMQICVISCHFGSCIGWFTWACFKTRVTERLVVPNSSCHIQISIWG